MIKIAAAFLLMMIHANTQNNQAGETIRRQIGRTYHEARKHLIEAGLHPDEHKKDRAVPCLPYQADICERYPEVASCAVDAFTPCRFEWISDSKKRFYVITRGSGVKSLVVVGYGEDE